mmetsp:Transcript_35693/g.84568  ORF Transcript_35693/g.84568 Transcript_35693/m.84568 type:complete len:411 (+) Transcript_35693:1047-2279(+)
MGRRGVGVVRGPEDGFLPRPRRRGGRRRRRCRWGERRRCRRRGQRRRDCEHKLVEPLRESVWGVDHDPNPVQPHPEASDRQAEDPTLFVDPLLRRRQHPLGSRRKHERAEEERGGGGAAGEISGVRLHSWIQGRRNCGAAAIARESDVHPLKLRVRWVGRADDDEAVAPGGPASVRKGNLEAEELPPLPDGHRKDGWRCLQETAPSVGVAIPALPRLEVLLPFREAPVCWHGCWGCHAAPRCPVPRELKGGQRDRHGGRRGRWRRRHRRDCLGVEVAASTHGRFPVGSSVQVQLLPVAANQRGFNHRFKRRWAGSQDQQVDSGVVRDHGLVAERVAPERGFERHTRAEVDAEELGSCGSLHRPLRARCSGAGGGAVAGPRCGNRAKIPRGRRAGGTRWQRRRSLRKRRRR